MEEVPEREEIDAVLQALLSELRSSSYPDLRKRLVRESKGRFTGRRIVDSQADEIGERRGPSWRVFGTRIWAVEEEYRQSLHVFVTVWDELCPDLEITRDVIIRRSETEDE